MKPVGIPSTENLANRVFSTIPVYDSGVHDLGVRGVLQHSTNFYSTFNLTGLLNGSDISYPQKASTPAPLKIVAVDEHGYTMTILYECLLNVTWLPESFRQG